MGEQKRKQEIITFKADEPLLEAMRGISNRSEFIRAAIYSRRSIMSVPCAKGAASSRSTSENTGSSSPPTTP